MTRFSNGPCGLHKEGEYTGVQYPLVFCQQTSLLLGNRLEAGVDGRSASLATYLLPASMLL